MIWSAPEPTAAENYAYTVWHTERLELEGLVFVGTFLGLEHNVVDEDGDEWMLDK